MPYSAPAATVPAQAQLPGWRNLLHNGDMRINQRQLVSATGINNAFRPVDRWTTLAMGAQNYSVAQDSSTTPTGFKNALLWTNGTAYTMAAGDFSIVNQALEGYDVQGLAYGTGGAAKNATLSFWVKVSTTGTYGGAIRINADAWSYLFTYTAVASPQFQQITIVIPPHLTVPIPADNGVRYEVAFSLGSGSTYTSAAGTAFTWVNNNFVTPPGCVNLSSIAGATWSVTGVQLEVGSTATSFEYRPYATELALCQRYFGIAGGGASVAPMIGIGIANSTNVAFIIVEMPVPMRAMPTTLSTSGTFNVTDRVSNWSVSAIAFNTISVSTSLRLLDITAVVSPTTLTARSPYELYGASTGAWVGASAEI